MLQEFTVGHTDGDSIVWNVAQNMPSLNSHRVMKEYPKKATFRQSEHIFSESFLPRVEKITGGVSGIITRDETSFN